MPSSERAFFASFVWTVCVEYAPFPPPTVTLFVNPALTCLSRFSNSGVIWLWSCLIDSGEKSNDLTSSLTSVLPASSRRASTIVWTCPVAKPCALRLSAKDVNASCASCAVDLDKVWMVGANCFWNPESSLSLSLALLTSFLTISLFLF